MEYLLTYRVKTTRRIRDGHFTEFEVEERQGATEAEERLRDPRDKEPIHLRVGSKWFRSLGLASTDRSELVPSLRLPTPVSATIITFFLFFYQYYYSHISYFAPFLFKIN